MRIGVLGGTFDPVHFGHLAMAEESRLQLGLDRVMFLPAGQPWLKAGQQLTPASHRVEMVRLAVASNPHFEVCSNEVERPGPTYTVDSLSELQAQLDQGATLFFIVGLDAMEQFDRWKEPERLLELCHWVVVERPGYEGFDVKAFTARYPGAAERVDVVSMPLMGISGSEIRRRVAAGTSVRYHVPCAVAEYIEKHRLYIEDFDKTADTGAETSSGGSPSRSAVARLLEVAVERGAIQYGRFTLTSGKESAYYFDGRLLSLDPEGARLIAQALVPILRGAGVEAVGGLTLGADPIVSSVAFASGLTGEGIPAFIVRKEAKAHGTGQSIEGPLRPGSRVAIVDDVCTTAGSLFQAIEAAEAVGCTVVKVAAILDRMEGGSEELKRRGYDFVALMAANPRGEIEAVRRT